MDALARALAPIVPAGGSAETVHPTSVNTAEDVTDWISVERSVLRDHLRQIYRSGISPDVVFERDLRVTALSKDQAFFIASPALDLEVFPWRVAMKRRSVGKWRKALGKFPSEEVRVRLRLHTPKGKQTKQDAGRDLPHQHVEIHDGGRVTFGIPTLLSPREAETAVDPHQAEQVLEVVAEGAVHPLPRSVCKAVRSAAKLKGGKGSTKASEIWLRVRPQGSEIQVGHETGQFSVLPFPQLKAEVEYDLLLQAKPFCSALKAVRDWEDAHLVLTGEDSIAAIRDGGWTYVMSPLG